MLSENIFSIIYIIVFGFVLGYILTSLKSKQMSFVLYIVLLLLIIVLVNLGFSKTIIPFIVFFLIGVLTVFQKIVDFLRSSSQDPETDKINEHDNQILHPISSTQLNEYEKTLDANNIILDDFVSQTEVNSSVSRTGVYYDDEDFWVLYKGELIATTISAKEGREYLKYYCKKHNLPL